MRKVLPNRYYKEHPVDVRCGAYLMYSLNADTRVMEKIAEIKEKRIHVADDQREIEKDILALEDPKEMLRFMRKELDGCNGELLRERLLENEQAMEPLIKEMTLTTRNDRFVDNAIMFFIRCQEDPTDWIIENYDNVRDIYMKGMLCLVLGFWDAEAHVEFLQEQVEALSGNDGSPEQGPLVALYMIERMARRDIRLTDQ